MAKETLLFFPSPLLQEDTEVLLVANHRWISVKKRKCGSAYRDITIFFPSSTGGHGGSACREPHRQDG
jgi:hypothetical protein